MFAVRVAGYAFKPQYIKTVLKAEFGGSISLRMITRAYMNRANTTVFRIAPGQTGFPFKTRKAISIEQLAVALSGILGLGAFCYYAKELSNDSGAINKLLMWSPVVKNRIRDTFLYLGASLAVTAGSAFVFYHSPISKKYFGFFKQRRALAFVSLYTILMFTNMNLWAVSYHRNFIKKRNEWLLQCCILGVAVSPIAFGGVLTIRAASISAGMIAGLSSVAMCAPSGEFIKWGGPLGLVLGGVATAPLGSILAPMFSMAMPLTIKLYGGLLFFSGLLLFGSHSAIRRVESDPKGYDIELYDPINASQKILLGPAFLLF